jgi:dihydroorotate dehydrogenase electron transfer subunit
VALAERILEELTGLVQVYAAGPVAMMQAAWALCERRSLPCQVSLEALMACGMGVCRSCVVDVHDPHPVTGLRRRAMCVEGPVFDAARLDWSTVVRAHG